LFWHWLRCGLALVEVWFGTGWGVVWHWLGPNHTPASKPHPNQFPNHTPTSANQCQTTPQPVPNQCQTTPQLPNHTSTSAKPHPNQCQTTPQPVPTSTGWGVVWHWLALVGTGWHVLWHWLKDLVPNLEKTSFIFFDIEKTKINFKGFVT
jgi:hypothetical protein